STNDGATSKFDWPGRRDSWMSGIRVKVPTPKTMESVRQPMAPKRSPSLENSTPEATQASSAMVAIRTKLLAWLTNSSALVCGSATASMSAPSQQPQHFRRQMRYTGAPEVRHDRRPQTRSEPAARRARFAGRGANALHERLRHESGHRLRLLVRRS